VTASARKRFIEALCKDKPGINDETKADIGEKLLGLAGEVQARIPIWPIGGRIRGGPRKDFVGFLPLYCPVRFFPN